MLAVCFASCNKDNGELSGDDIIQFKDENFLKALLVVQEIEIRDKNSDEFIPYTVDIDENRDGQIAVNEAKNVKGLALYDSETYELFTVTDISEIKYFSVNSSILAFS